MPSIHPQLSPSSHLPDPCNHPVFCLLALLKLPPTLHTTSKLPHPLSNSYPLYPLLKTQLKYHLLTNPCLHAVQANPGFSSFRQHSASDIYFGTWSYLVDSVIMYYLALSSNYLMFRNLMSPVRVQKFFEGKNLDFPFSYFASSSQHLAEC